MYEPSNFKHVADAYTKLLNVLSSRGAGVSYGSFSVPLSHSDNTIRALKPMMPG